MIYNSSYPLSVELCIGETKRNMQYWLTDGIYPKLLLFLHSMINPKNEDGPYFDAREEDRKMK